MVDYGTPGDTRGELIAKSPPRFPELWRDSSPGHNLDGQDSQGATNMESLRAAPSMGVAKHIVDILTVLKQQPHASHVLDSLADDHAG